VSSTAPVRDSKAIARHTGKEEAMKVLSCRDVGVDCDYRAHGKTVDEVLRKATEHAKRDHNIKKVLKDYLDSWKTRIHDE